MLIFAGGLALGWSSPSIPKLMNPDNPVHITADEGSWVVALMELGMGVSALPSVIMMDKYVGHLFGYYV